MNKELLASPFTSNGICAKCSFNGWCPVAVKLMETKHSYTITKDSKLIRREWLIMTIILKNSLTTFFVEF